MSNTDDLRMFCHAVDSRMTDNDLLVGLRSLTGLTARIDELEADNSKLRRYLMASDVDTP
jgi:hypothetical protein